MHHFVEEGDRARAASQPAREDDGDLPVSPADGVAGRGSFKQVLAFTFKVRAIPTKEDFDVGKFAAEVFAIEVPIFLLRPGP